MCVMKEQLVQFYRDDDMTMLGEHVQTVGILQVFGITSIKNPEHNRNVFVFRVHSLIE